MRKEILTVDQTPHERKKTYLTEIIKRGIYMIIPGGLSAQQWSMRRKIGFQYALTEKNLTELGQQYGVSREDARRLNHSFLDHIYQTSPQQLQAQYPRKTIPDRKPWTQKSRERGSAARGGLSLKVKWLIEQGITDSKQTMDILGISARDLARTRRTLRRWGINVPQTFKSRKEIFTEKLRDENDDAKLQELLDSLSTGSLEGLLRRDPGHKILTTASAIANKKGFHAHTRRVRLIVETIEEAKIPIRRIVRPGRNGKTLSSYYIVFTKHSNRIARALKNNPDLQRYKIKSTVQTFY